MAKATRYVIPQAEHLAGSTVIQQMGLDTEMGLQRLLQILLIKFDPGGYGIRVTLNDLNKVAAAMVEKKRNTMLVRGEDDAVFLKMATAEEVAALSKKPSGGGG